MYRKSKHIHFVGIGGIGMSGIAELLLNLGYRISGSDLQESDITHRLESLGGEVHIGHDSAWIGEADVVVTSSAIDANNPEVQAAVNSLIPVIPRAEMCGTHAAYQVWHCHSRQSRQNNHYINGGLAPCRGRT